MSENTKIRNEKHPWSVTSCFICILLNCYIWSWLLCHWLIALGSSYSPCTNENSQTFIDPSCRDGEIFCGGSVWLYGGQNTALSSHSCLLNLYVYQICGLEYKFYSFDLWFLLFFFISLGLFLGSIVDVVAPPHLWETFLPFSYPSYNFLWVFPPSFSTTVLQNLLNLL